jgi:hypothetical protein
LQHLLSHAKVWKNLRNVIACRFLKLIFGTSSIRLENCMWKINKY